MYKKVLWEEFDLYIRYIQRYNAKVKIISKYIYFYRKHKKSMSFKKNWIKKAWQQLIKKYNRDLILKFGKIPKLFIG